MTGSICVIFNAPVVNGYVALCLIERWWICQRTSCLGFGLCSRKMIIITIIELQGRMWGCGFALKPLTKCSTERADNITAPTNLHEVKRIIKQQRECCTHLVLVLKVILWAWSTSNYWCSSVWANSFFCFSIQVFRHIQLHWLFLLSSQTSVTCFEMHSKFNTMWMNVGCCTLPDTLYGT